MELHSFSTLQIHNIDKYKFPSPNDLLEFFGRFGALTHISIEPQLGGLMSSGEESTSAKAQPGGVFQAKITYFLEDNAQKGLAALHNLRHGKYRLFITPERTKRLLYPAYVPPWQKSQEFFANAAVAVLRNTPGIDASNVDRAKQAMDEHQSHEPFITYVPQFHEIPSELRYLMDTTAKFVASHGQQFEEAIRRAEKENELFGLFLSDEISQFFSNDDKEMDAFVQKCRTYYHWRVFSFLNGDSLRSWRSAPYQPVYGGPVVFPPENKSNQENVASKPHVDEALAEGTRNTLFALLRFINTTNESVATVSNFVIQCADRMADVVEILKDSMEIPETPAEKFLARLYVLNDVLHNAQTWGDQTSLPVKKFIGQFRPHIKCIIRHAYNTADRLDGTNAVATMRTKIDAVIRTWAEACFFPEMNLDEV